MTLLMLSYFSGSSGYPDYPSSFHDSSHDCQNIILSLDQEKLSDLMSLWSDADNFDGSTQCLATEGKFSASRERERRFLRNSFWMIKMIGTLTWIMILFFFFFFFLPLSFHLLLIQMDGWHRNPLPTDESSWLHHDDEHLDDRRESQREEHLVPSKTRKYLQ